METKTTYSLQEIADHYNVCKRTLHKWLKPIYNQLKEMNPTCTNRIRLLTPKQWNFIKEFLG